MPPEDNEAAIRVQLSLLNAQDSAAARDLANSLKEISKMFEALKASDFRESATKMAQLHAQMMRDSQMMQQQATNQQMQQRGGGIRSAVNRVLGRTPEVSNADLATAGDPIRAAAEAEKEKARAAEDQRRADEKERLTKLQGMTDAERQAYHRRERFQGMIPPEGGDPNAWFNRIGALNPEAQRGFRIPQFGQITLQDVIAQAQGGALRRAEDAAGQGNWQAMDRYGRSAQGLDTTSRWVGNAYAAREGFRRLTGFAGAQGFSPAGMDASGAALGYRRDTNPFSDILGIQTPFSAAGREGVRQSLDIQRLRFQAGINKEQAAGIVGAAAGAGFSGEQGSAVARDFMAPLFRQFQIDPTQLAGHLQVLRTGTATLGDLSASLADIGETARTAQVDVSTMNQALQQAGEASQAMGGTYMQGLAFGNTFTRTTGLLPGVGQTVLQNPTTQAFLSGATGLPSFALAAAPTDAKMQASRQALSMYYDAYKGSLGTTAPRSAIKDAQGNVVGYSRGTNPALAAVAQQFGISGDEADRMMRGQDRQSRLASLSSALDEYEKAGRDTGDRRDFNAARAAVRDLGPTYRVNPRTGAVEHLRASRGQTAGRLGRATPQEWVRDEDKTREFNERSGRSTMSMLDRTDSSQVGLDDVRKLAAEAGVNGHLVAKAVREGKTVQERTQKIRRLVDEQTASDRAKYEIAFTGPAAKFFKALAKKNGMEDQFNELPNATAASARGPAPLSDLTNSAQAVNNNLMTPRP